MPVAEEHPITNHEDNDVPKNMPAAEERSLSSNGADPDTPIETYVPMSTADVQAIPSQVIDEFIEGVIEARGLGENGLTYENEEIYGEDKNEENDDCIIPSVIKRSGLLLKGASEWKNLIDSKVAELDEFISSTEKLIIEGKRLHPEDIPLELATWMWRVRLAKYTSTRSEDPPSDNECSESESDQDTETHKGNAVVGKVGVVGDEDEQFKGIDGSLDAVDGFDIVLQNPILKILIK